MIARHWKGLAKLEEAENYISHLQAETFPALSKIDGFINASILKRVTGEGVEFLVVTNWHSLDAIRQFAGDDATVAVVPPKVQAMMLRYDPEVLHYEIVES